MYTLKLISEHIENPDYLIEEKEDGKKDYKIKGIFMQADIKNRNGRVYPMEVLNKEVKRYNKEYIGEAKILSTPMGGIVKNLMDEGAKLGVSSRGMGSLDQKNGVNYVRNDFYLATAADIVADPSAPNAFVEGIMEGKEWIWNNGMISEAEVAEIKENIEENSRTNNSKSNALEFAKFLQKL